jgi:hypothetical protein
MKEKKLIAVYNVSQIDYPISLVSNIDFYDNIVIDGKDKINGLNYQFDTVGEHLVEIELKGDEIGEEAFYQRPELISVIIGNGVTTIDEYAFYECENLKSVTIPDSVTTINRGAFALCYELTNVTIGSGVERIGDYAFSYCTGLTSVTIPSGVISVGSVGSNVFCNCDKLQQIVINH